MNLIEKAKNGTIKKTGETKSINVSGLSTNLYEVYSIPLDFLFYNDQNGRINTAYRKYKAEYGEVEPEIGDSEYNKLFEKFIYESNKPSLDKTMWSIKGKGQQEMGAVLPDGRVIDGNRRFTALRKIHKSANTQGFFKAIIIDLDENKEADKKIIKQLELDLQLAREERVSYNPIDRIFDVYNTIVIMKQMTPEEYRDASGQKNTTKINRDIRLAELILKFIEIFSPGGDPVDKFYLARDLDLDGPIEEIESTITKLKSDDKVAITDAVLTYMGLTKTYLIDDEPKNAIRKLKNDVLNNPQVLPFYLNSVDEKVDDIIDAFIDKPIKTSNDLNQTITENQKLVVTAEKMINATERLITKGNFNKKRTKVLDDLIKIRESLEIIDIEDIEELKSEEKIRIKDTLSEILDEVYRIRKRKK